MIDKSWQGELGNRLNASLGSRIEFDFDLIVHTPTPWSFSFPAELDQKLVFVRIAADSHLEDEAFTEEIHIADRLASLGLAPRLFHTDVRHGIMVMEYIHAEINGKSGSIRTLAHNLRILHECPLQYPSRQNDHRTQMALDFMSRLDLGKPHFRDFQTPYSCIQDFLRNSVENPKFCHFDLNPTNVIWSNEKQYFIDFDFCGLGDPLLDVATVSIWACNSNASLREFLELYFENAVSTEQIEQVQNLRKISLARYACLTLYLLERDISSMERLFQSRDTRAPFNFDPCAPDRPQEIYNLARSFARAAS